MPVLSAIRHRHSVRAFTAERLTNHEIERILDAAALAPSAGNLQAFDVAVVRSPDAIAALSAAALSQPCVASAACALVFLASPARNTERYGDRGRELYAVQDAACAAAYALLQATGDGLGGVWVGAFSDSEVAALVQADVESGQRPVAILALGHPAPGEPHIHAHHRNIVCREL
jgi:nitroreductase